jgi:hypothetical protein
MITPAEAGGHENGDSAQFNHRVIDPAQLSRFRVECKHAIEPSCNVQGSIYQNRSWLQAAALLAVGAVGNIAHMNGPGDLQRRYILSIDLRQRRIPYAAHVSTVKKANRYPVRWGDSPTAPFPLVCLRRPRQECL